MPPITKLLFAVGGLLIAVGFLVWLFGNKLNWFGQLPGDVRVERENFRFYAPFASMLLLSLLLSAVLWLVRRIF